MDKSNSSKKASTKKSGKVVTRSPRSTTNWSADKRNRAAANDEFLQVVYDDPSKEAKFKSNRKFGGAEKCWQKKETSDYIFEPVSRLCGPEEIVRDVLDTNFPAIKKAMSKDKTWAGRLANVEELMDNAWTAKNHTKNDEYLKEKKRVEENKSNTKEARDSGKPRGKFSIDDIDVILDTVKNVRASNTNSTSSNEEKKPRIKGGIFAMNAKARKEGRMLDVSKMSHIKGTATRPLLEDDIERLGLKTVYGVENMIIYSNNAASFNAAMLLLASRWPFYKDYVGKWDVKIDKGTKKITDKQVQKEISAVTQAKKVTKKKSDDSDDSEDEAEGSEAESEEDEKPKKNKKANGETKVNLKKKPAGDDEEKKAGNSHEEKDAGNSHEKKEDEEG